MPSRAPLAVWVRRIAAKMLSWITRPLTTAPFDIPRARVRVAPSPQTALDIFRGEWTSKLPRPLGEYRAGAMPLFEDARMTWALERLDVSGARVLELGPLEAGHSYMLQQRGAREIISIEADPGAYLRCLVIKECLGLDRVRFLCGDFLEYLRATHERFDVCVASGVLYHMTAPVEVLHRIADVADSTYLWTLYYDGQRLSTSDRNRFVGPVPVSYADLDHQVYRQEYRTSRFKRHFCGGVHDHSCWMSRDGIVACLAHAGMTVVDTGFDEPNHEHGPSFALVARRGVRTGVN